MTATRPLATIVLVGVQPSLIQVPPTCTRSIRAVFHPARARVVESGPPAWPAPITIASYCVVGVIFFHLLVLSHRLYVLSPNHIVIPCADSLHLRDNVRENEPVKPDRSIS